jgi:hypothetical protein
METNYLLRKVAGRLVKLDPDIFHNPRISNSSLMIAAGHRVVVCDYKNKKYFSLPRFVANAQKGQIVDHINRDTFDNRRCNLRIVNARQSNLNRRLRSNTGFIGVSKTQKRKNKFCCEAYFQPKTGKRNKFYSSVSPKGLILAALARDRFVIQNGEQEYAPLNFPVFKKEPFKTFLLKIDLNEYKRKTISLEKPLRQK